MHLITLNLNNMAKIITDPDLTPDEVMEFLNSQIIELKKENERLKTLVQDATNILNEILIDINTEKPCL